MRNPVPRPWRIPALLITISLVPLAATTNRLLWLSDASAAPDPAMARFEGSYSILVFHIVIGCMFLILAAPQFSPELRTRYPFRHRFMGRIVMIAGIMAGLSGVWLVLAYPPGELTTPIMDIVRAVFGSILAGTIVLAFAAIRRRDFARHRAWMIRAFAVGIAGSTQALIIGLWLVFYGTLTPESATVLISLGFAANVAFAEWRIRTLKRGSSSTILSRV